MKDLVTKGAEHFGIYIDETTAENSIYTTNRSFHITKKSI